MKYKMIPLPLAIWIAVIVSQSGVAAAALPVGDVLITGTSAAAQPGLAGIILEETFTPYDFYGSELHVTGMLQSRVVRSSLTGTLDFYWRVIPDAASTGDIYAFRVGGFPLMLLDANWRIDDLGSVGPQVARNFGSGNVNFLFTPAVYTPGTVGIGLHPADSSRFFFLRTDATAYGRVGIYDLLSDDGISELFTTFAPVPEPSTLGLGALGILGLIARHWFARQKKAEGPGWSSASAIE